MMTPGITRFVTFAVVRISPCALTRRTGSRSAMPWRSASIGLIHAWNGESLCSTSLAAYVECVVPLWWKSTIWNGNSSVTASGPSKPG